MAYSRTTLLMLAQLATRMRKETLRTIDVEYMGMSARYADHVLGIALKSQNAELKALGALLRHDFFGPAGVFPGGRMLWCAIETDRGVEVVDNGPETLDFSAPPPSGETPKVFAEKPVMEARHV